MNKSFSLNKNKFDVYIFNLLILLSALLLVVTNLFNQPTTNLVVNVYVEAELIDTLSLDDNVTIIYLKEDYPIFLDDITLEINNRRVRVEKETSPLHYCSIQGYIKNPGMPIICAPNYFMAVIEGQAL